MVLVVCVKHSINGTRNDKLQAENEEFWSGIFGAFLILSLKIMWEGKKGFNSNVLYENYLKESCLPEDCEYYQCVGLQLRTFLPVD